MSCPPGALAALCLLDCCGKPINRLGTQASASRTATVNPRWPPHLIRVKKNRLEISVGVSEKLDERRREGQVGQADERANCQLVVHVDSVQMMQCRDWRYARLLSHRGYSGLVQRDVPSLNGHLLGGPD